MNEATLIIEGPFPSKKNEYGRTAKGQVYIPNDMKVRLYLMERDIRRQWGMRPPVLHPDMAWEGRVRHRRSDRDNIKTTVMDCLVRCGVLVDDDIAHNNGNELTRPWGVNAGAKGEDRIVLRLNWKDDAEESQSKAA